MPLSLVSGRRGATNAAAAAVAVLSVLCLAVSSLPELTRSSSTYKAAAQQNPRSDGSPASLARSPRAPVMGSNYTSLPDGLPSPDGGPQSFAPPLPAASQQRRGLWDR